VTYHISEASEFAPFPLNRRCSVQHIELTLNCYSNSVHYFGWTFPSS